MSKSQKRNASSSSSGVNSVSLFEEIVQKIASSSSSGVNFVRLCEEIVQKIEEIVYRGKVLNARLCEDLAAKLSGEIAFVREVVKTCWGWPLNHTSKFVPLLADLHRYFEKAEVLVKQCGDEDWCAAAVFKGRDMNSFRNILVHVTLVGSQIYERAKEYTSDISSMHRAFALLHNDDVDSFGDTEELRQRLEGLASEQNSSFRMFGLFVSDQEVWKQHLARYLLQKNKAQLPLGNPFTDLEALKTILWEKESEPAGTWGDSMFLGAGSGASGVCKTSWLGIPCAKKEFHGEALR